MKYYTKEGMVVKLQKDSIGSRWRPGTNDFEIYDKYIADLNWKSYEDALKDLKNIAKAENLKGK